MTYAPNRCSQDPGRRALSGAVVGIWLVLWGGLMGLDPVFAQTSESDPASLLERYQVARQRLVVRRQLLRQGGVDILPIEALSTPTDSLRPPESKRKTASASEPSFPLRHVRPIRRLEREWFRQRFRDVRWSFLGATPEHSFFDTTRTVELRARLQSEFGDPTQTLADVEPPIDTSGSGPPQFEYWFIVNDSIPVQVMDSRGPRGRGLVLVAQRKYRDRLGALRDTLLAPVRRAERAPFVDYYYEGRRNRWYRTGFDGEEFFLERISNVDYVPGRRPRLDSTRTSEDAGPPDDEEPR